MSGVASVERRAERLVRVYPDAWRARYGEELTQLLIDDMHERPLALSRTVDLVGHGLWARMAYAGVVGDVAAPERRAGGLGSARGHGRALLDLRSRDLVTVGDRLAVVGARGAGDARGHDGDDRRAPRVRRDPCAGGAANPDGAHSSVNVSRGGAIWRPLALMLIGAVVLWFGCRHFAAGWPGTGGHRWSDRDLVPGTVARVAWAGTLWITSYWAHPGALGAFPGSEIAWMAASPVALIAVLVGGLRTLGRLELSARTRRWETCMAAVAAALMVAFLAGAGSWVLSGGTAPKNLFKIGAIDVLALVVLTGALVLMCHALRRALMGSTRRQAA